MKCVLCKYVRVFVPDCGEIIPESFRLQKKPFLPKLMFSSLSVSHYFKKQRAVNRLVEHMSELNSKF